MVDTICTVTIHDWEGPLSTLFGVKCKVCKRALGTFTVHESAMAWADAHARSSKHIRG